MQIGATRIMIFLLLTSTAFAETQSTSETTLDFDNFEVGTTPAGFSTALTGGGGPVSWVIKEESSAPSGGEGLAQTRTRTKDYRLPLCIHDQLTAQDGPLPRRLQGLSGKVEQAAWLLAPFRD